MATTSPTTEIDSTSALSGGSLLVLLSSLTQDQLGAVLDNLAAAFPAGETIVAVPDALPADSHPSLRLVAAPVVQSSWTLTADGFVNACQLAKEHQASSILMLGPDPASLGLPALRQLGNAVAANSTDLALPCYDLPPHAALVNSAILYPLSRALFASRARFPLAIDMGLSLRMAEQLSINAQRLIALKQDEAPLWPVNEAALAGFKIDEFDVGPRMLPQPAEGGLNTILPLVTASLFSDIEAKAVFWQRPRQLPPARKAMRMAPPPPPDTSADIASMLQTFRLAYTNLQEVWSLVLPPNSLLGLKRLYGTDAAAFRMPESLWARIVYDFLLAYRLRTINRGHLLGALVPLYLACAASHINITASGASPERHIEAVASAFEVEKPYILSRWRWPDRFNP